MPTHVPIAPASRRRSPPDPPSTNDGRVVVGRIASGPRSPPRSPPRSTPRAAEASRATVTTTAIDGAGSAGRARNYASPLVTAAQLAPSRSPPAPRAGSLPVAVVVVGLPLLVAAIALRGERWYPVLDLAMTEFRVRDVGTSHTPLIGLPGRIGEYPDQGSHPGPLSFYLLAPVYRLLGSSSWALEAGTVAIHLAAIATALWIGHRRAGWRGVAAVGALLAVVVRGYGQVPLTQPWNPYLPLVAWIVVLLAAWAVLCGDHLMLIPLVVAATLLRPDPRAVPAARRRDGRPRPRSSWSPALRRTSEDRTPRARCAASRGRSASASCSGSRRSSTSSPTTRATSASSSTTSARRRNPPSASATASSWPSATSTSGRPRPPGRRHRLVRLQHVGVAGDDRPRGVDRRRGGRVAHRVAGACRRCTSSSASRSCSAWSRWPASSDARGSTSRSGPGASRRSWSGPCCGPRSPGGSSAADDQPPPGRRSASPSPPASSRSSPRSSPRSPSPAPTIPRSGSATPSARSPPRRTTPSSRAPARPPGRTGATSCAGATPPTSAAPASACSTSSSGAASTSPPTSSSTCRSPTTGRGRVPKPTPRSTSPRAATSTSGARCPTPWRWPSTTRGRTSSARSTPTVRARFVERLGDEGLDELVPLVDTNLFGMSVDPRLSAADQADLTRLIELGQPMAVFIAPPPADDDPTAL